MNYIIKVCDGLLYMHSQSTPVVYGSLSPQNIIIGGSGKVKLSLDYGLSDIAKTGSSSGIKGFAAPEQRKGKCNNVKSDIYGIGALMFFLLSGKTFVIKKSGPLRKYNKKVPRALEKLISRCLSPKTSNRPDIQELSRELSRIYLREIMRKATRPSEKKDTQLEEPEKNIEEKPAPSISRKKKEKSEESTLPEKKKKKTKTDGEKEEKRKKEAGKRRTKIIDLREETDRKKTVEKKKKITESEEEKKKAGKRRTKIIDLREERKKKKAKEDDSEERTGTDTLVLEEAPEIIKEQEGDETEPDNTADKETNKEDLTDEENEKKDTKKKPRRVSALTRLLVKAIKKKEAEKEETDEEAIQKEEMAEKGPAQVETVPEEEATAPDGAAKTKDAGTEDKTSSRSASIASFLRMKSGLSDEAYEVNEEALKRKKMGTGLSEEFLASLKVSSAHSFSVREGEEEEVKEARLAPYNKPHIPPPLPLYEEIDMLKDNRYEVGELLHKDCYGAVYIVQDYDEQEEDKEEKILKEIQYKGKDAETVARLTARFQKVCEELKNLQNPGLAVLEDYFYELSEDNLSVKLCLIYEYVEGMTFEEIALTYYKEDEKSKMPAQTVFGVITKVYSALEYLHERGIVYGDLRASNLKLTPDGNVKFLNYGLAGIFQGLDEHIYPFKGTYGYTAPELLALPDGDRSSDIFSLGAVMYFMLTGNKPEDVKYKFVSIRKFNPYLTLQVERFVRTFLNFTPSHRPDINQINRVINSIDFFEVVKKDTENQKKFKEEEEDLPKKKDFFEPAKEKFEEISFMAKKIPTQLSIAGVFFLIGIIALFIWVRGYIQETTIGEDTAYIFLDGKPGIIAFNLRKNKIYKEFSLDDCRGNTAYSKSRKELYILDKGKRIFILDLTGAKLINTISLKNKPYGIVFDDKKDKFYITFPKSGELGIISREEKKVEVLFSVGKSPLNILFLEEASLLLISDFSSNKVFGFNIDTRKIDFEVEVGQGPRSMLYIPEREILYVANWTSNDISVVYVPSAKLAYTIPTGENPSAIALSSDCKTVYVSNQNDFTISVIDVDTHKVIKTIKTDGEPLNLALTSDGEELLVCLKKDHDNKVSILDTLTFASKKDIPLEETPLNIFLPNKL